MSDGFFPGIRDLADETFREVMRELEGGGIRLRCAMPEFQVTGKMGWKHKPVTYSPRLSLPGLDDATVLQVFKDACAAWNAVADIGLQFSTDHGRANIYANSGKIDGSSGTLAWSYLPSNATLTTRIEQLYDDKEEWSIPWLTEVITHELGHGLGLSHSTSKADIMYPYSAAGRITRPQPGDIARLLDLGYDKPAVDPTPGIPEVAGVLIINGKPYGVSLDPQ